MRAHRLRAATGAVAVVGILALTGCSYEDLNSLPLPGTEGRGAGSYQVKVQIRDASQLVPNSAVKVANVTVGTIEDISLNGWHAELTISLNDDVTLPANSVAKVGQTSLLGAKYLELAPPTTEPPRGQLTAGDVIPLARTGTYPATENVLASASVVLNGAGLANLKTIVGELNHVLGGRGVEMRRLVDRLGTFSSSLDGQTGEILRTIEELNRFAGRVAKENHVLADAVERIEPALEVLNRQRPEIVRALKAVTKFSDTANRVLGRTREDLVANLTALKEPLRELADAGQAVIRSLGLIGTVIFPLETVPTVFQGDYFNLYVTLDLTLRELDRTFLSGTPAEGELAAVANLLAGGNGGGAEGAPPLLSQLRPGTRVPGSGGLDASPPSASDRRADHGKALRQPPRSDAESSPSGIGTPRQSREGQGNEGSLLPGLLGGR